MKIPQTARVWTHAFDLKTYYIYINEDNSGDINGIYKSCCKVGYIQQSIYTQLLLRKTETRSSR